MMSDKSSGFLRGFFYAGRGILCCFKERNMRFHGAAMAYVLFFSRYYDLTRGEYALLFVTFACVLCLEAVNTAIEHLCDRVCSRRDGQIEKAKDCAAAAVLLGAVFSVCVGLCLFWRVPVLLQICKDVFLRPLPCAGFVCSLAAAYLWVFGPQLLRRKKKN